jgi:hypothetical protein
MRFDHVAQQVPDIADAVEWWRTRVPGTTVRYQDETWALIDAAGVPMSLVMADQHPSHLAFRVSDDELERLAAEQGRTVNPHRDGTRSFYAEAPGGQWLEVIAYPHDEDDRRP